MSRPTRHRYGGSRRAVAVAGGALALVTLLGATEVLASVIVGSPGDDVSEGQDRDNAANALVQPPGVGVPQHLSNTDVVFGRLGDDFIAGRAGDDVVVGGEGDDVLVGGPDERGWPGSDVLLGDEGDDVAVWGTGDRSESFVGDVGRDTQVVGRLLLTAGGDMRTTRAAGRVLPRASLLAGPQRCELTRVPGAEGVGEQYLLRVFTGRQMTATLRMRDVEQVVCSSPTPRTARVADLTAPSPAFVQVPLSALDGVVRAIVAP